MLNTTATMTLLLTTSCPLACRYCSLDEQITPANSGKKFTYEYQHDLMSRFIADHPNQHCHFLFTGGEPLLEYPILIRLMKEFAEQNVSYELNTSGYLFTQAILAELSHYRVTFNLSVDGDEEVTNYLRPTRNPSSPSYWSRFSAIAPYLLYYFPNTPAKIIITPDLISKLYTSYVAISNLGFNYINFILDMTNRDDLTHTNGFTETHLTDLSTQFSHIFFYMAQQFSLDRRPCLPFIIDRYIADRAAPLFTPNDLGCGLFNGRQLASIFSQPEGFVPDDRGCYSAFGYTQQEFYDLIAAAIPTECPNDPTCPHLPFCLRRSCVKDNIEIHKEPFKIELGFCRLARMLGDNIINLLHYCNNHQTPAYVSFLKENFKKEGN